MGFNHWWLLHVDCYIWYKPSPSSTLSFCAQDRNCQDVSLHLVVDIIAQLKNMYVIFSLRAIWWQIAGIGGLLAMCSYAGMVMFAYYYQELCDPLEIKVGLLYSPILYKTISNCLIILQLVDKKDQMFPLFVMQVMGDIPCIPGLFVAGVFSGALSTVSSGLNALAAVALQDFVEAGCNIQLSEKIAVITTKAFAVGFGVLSYLIIFLVKYLPGVLEVSNNK